MLQYRASALAAVIFSAFVIATQVEAVPITGGVRFAGAIAPTDFTATSAIDIQGNAASVGCELFAPCTGTYAVLNGADATAVYNDFSFDPLPSGGVAPLWITTVGGITFSFDLTNVTSITRNTQGIVIGGFGVAHVTGFDDTLATWSFSADQTEAILAFSSTTSALYQTQTPVPEPTSMLLLGTGLAGLSIAVRRRLVRK